jgi:hypothetical protein
MSRVETTFAHAATLRMEPGSDSRAPGGAVTVALCGSWSHGDQPCVWPHHTVVEEDGPQIVVRTVFRAGQDDEAEVRRRIEQALRDGRLVGPDGRESRWVTVASGPADPGDDEW